MLSIRGIYNGKEIKPLEKIDIRPNVQVIITFLDNESKEPLKNQEVKEDLLSKSPTELFLEKCGGWEDTRHSGEIIDEIYSLRSQSDRGADLFSESRK